MRKKVIIVEHNGGQLGNQLWNFINIYAYCIERGYACRNYCFYRYDRYFDTRLINPLLDRIARVTPGRIKERVYKKYRQYLAKKNGQSILRADHMDGEAGVPWYLPPSPSRSPTQQQALETAEADSGPIYMAGWLFRNPVGIQKYRDQILGYIKPRRSIKKRVEQKIAALRQSYAEIVGVHIRQGDYKTYMGGRFYFSPQDVRLILDSYIAARGNGIDTVCFVICSDGPLPKNIFDGLRVVYSTGTPVEDWYTLSQTDRVIGSDSTFGGTAAWYGDIPITFFTHSPIVWGPILAQKRFVYDNGSYNLQL